MQTSAISRKNLRRMADFWRQWFLHPQPEKQPYPTGGIEHIHQNGFLHMLIISPDELREPRSYCEKLLIDRTITLICSNKNNTRFG